MSDLIMIEPTREPLTDDVAALEIQLGGAPRGLVVLLTGQDTPEGEVVEVLNTLAAEGFEGLALTSDAPESVELALARAAVRGWHAEQIGVVGIGAGATAALELARTRALGAVVSISPAPRLDVVLDDPVLRTPWLGLFGSEAGDLDAGEISLLRTALESGSDVFSRVVVYPGVGADFHRRSEDGVSFSASYDGWQRVVEWLLARVAGRLTPLALAWRERQAG